MASKKKDAELSALLAQMGEEGLRAQIGGFDVQSIPTGIASFDRSTGINGIPLKRLTLFKGREGAGKTLMLLSLIAEIQRNGKRAAFIDAEHALTPGFAKLLGVNYDDLVIACPETLNEAYEFMKAFCKSGLFTVVGFDSANSLTTIEDLEISALDGAKRAAEAQIHSSELKKLIPLCHPKTAMVMIGQIRSNPNPPPGYRGTQEYMPGGSALRHAASLLVEVKTTVVFRNSAKQRIGHRTRTYIVKNKVAQPYRAAEFDMNYETGLDTLMDLMNTAILTGIIKKKSSFYYFNHISPEGEIVEEIRENGRAKIEAKVKSDLDLIASLRMQVSGGGGDGDVVDIDRAQSGWAEVGD